MPEKTKTTAFASSLKWPPLIKGTLVKRYKRFLADIRLETGELVTAHCPNSGTMKACCEPGRPVYISYHDNPKRKLKYTWELIHMPDSLVGVNTQVPNRLTALSIEAGRIKELSGYDRLKREVRVGNSSRLDILLESGHQKNCYVEVKNCTLVDNHIARFPDAVTTRGQKHLLELELLKAKGFRCVMFFLVQRQDAGLFKPADAIDPEYGKKLRNAAKKGVEILVYDVAIDLDAIRINKKLPYDLKA